MITVYKMGKLYYDKLKVDKNSGLTEVKIIENELKDIKILNGKKVLIIVNGIRYPEDEAQLIDLMKEHDVKIFIMSDVVSMKQNVDLMNACDYVLHQAKDYKFRGIKKAIQLYGYVPELFYKHCKSLINDGKIEAKKDKALKFVANYSGNDLGREDKFLDYDILNSKHILGNLKIYSTGSDNRKSHDEYLEELAKFRYALIICHKEFREISWITSRFFEALALDVYPLVDIDYDIALRYTGNVKKISNKHDMASMIRFLNIFPEIRSYEMSSMQLLATSNQDMFKKVILEIFDKKGVKYSEE